MQHPQVIQLLGASLAGPDQRVERLGILTEHAVKISRFCYRTQRLLILRAASAASVPFRRRNPCGHSDDVGAKPVLVKEKTGADGLTSHGFYSDYDILSYWQLVGTSFRQIITGSTPPPRFGAITPANTEAFVRQYFLDVPIALLELATATGIADFQHGANDEYVDAAGKPKVQLRNERFVAFDQDALIHLVPDTGAMRRFYDERGLEWIYKFG